MFRAEVGVSRIVDSVADRDGEAGSDVAVELAETADGVYGLVVKGIEALSDSGVVGSDCFADECFALKSPASELQVHFRNHSPGGRDVCDGLSGEVDRARFANHSSHGKLYGPLTVTLFPQREFPPHFDIGPTVVGAGHQRVGDEIENDLLGQSEVKRGLCKVAVVEVAFDAEARSNITEIA